MRIVKLTHGMTARVDDADYERVSRHNWHVKTRETSKSIRHYAGTNLRRGPKAADGYRWIMMHRFILNEPDGEIDHIDGDGLNNCRDNLRVCTHAENMRNRRTYSETGYLGVTVKYRAIKRGRGSWKAALGKRSLGHFSSAEAAARAYDAAATKEYGEFARLNFPILSDR